jgi:3'(2'), 5'-bisphosphate nucleotidase
MSQSPNLTESDIAYIRETATRAGNLAIKMRQGVEVKEKSPNDLVTAADLELSKLIVERLRLRFPNDLIVSEEDEEGPVAGRFDRVWLVDPIDGTDNYVANDGQYSVMIGLLIDLKPEFGCVFAPASDTLYYGGTGYGAWRSISGKQPQRYGVPGTLSANDNARLMMGYRDRKLNPWVIEHAKVSFVKAGSVGLKVAKILDDQADVFVHFAKKLKAWDTAGPAAIGLGGGLQAGTLEADMLSFPLPAVVHSTSVIVGRPGSLDWCRLHLNKSKDAIANS